MNRRGRKPFPSTTPLGRYLARTGTTQTQFARKLSEVAGWRIFEQQVSRWCLRVGVPNNATRRLIAQATGGEVTVESWAGVKPKRQARAA